MFRHRLMAARSGTSGETLSDEAGRADPLVGFRPDEDEHASSEARPEEQAGKSTALSDVAIVGTLTGYMQDCLMRSMTNTVRPVCHGLHAGLPAPH